MAHPIESSIVLTDAACKLLFIDTGTLIEIDGSTNLSFTDAITGTKTLAELAGSSLWLRNAGASYVYPATSGDNVWVDVGSAIYLGGANNKIHATSSSSMRFYVGGVNRLFIGNGDVSLENSNLLCNLNGTLGDSTHFWYGAYSSDYTVDNVDTVIARDGSGNLTFVDGVTSIKTLAQLASAGTSITIGDTGEIPYSNAGTPGTDFNYASAFHYTTGKLNVDGGINVSSLASATDSVIMATSGGIGGLTTSAYFYFSSNTLTIGGGSATTVFDMDTSTGSYAWTWTATGDTSLVLNHYTDTFVTFDSNGATFEKGDVITDGVFKSTGGATIIYSIADVDTRITLAPATAQYSSFYYWEEGTSTMRDMRFGESTANNGIYWDASANRMGIQDDTPSYTLDVNGTFGINGNMSITGSRTISPISTATAYSLTVKAGDATSSDGGTLTLNGGNTTGLGSDGGDIDIVGGSSTTTTGGHVYITGNPSSSTDGNVYIGRNAAGTIADANCIIQNTGEVGFYLRSSLTTNDVAIRFQQGTTSGTTVGIIGWDDSASRMTIQAGITLGNTGRFSMSSTSIYYYGGSTASLYLDAVSSVSSVYLDSASTSDSRIYFRNDTTYRFIVGYDYSASNFQIHSSASFTSTADFQISLAGDISMGVAPSTTYPLNMYKSHTSGTQYMINIYHDGNNAAAAQGIRMQMGLDTLTTSDQNYILALDGNGTTVGALLADSTSFRIYNAVSSKNYKKNIRPMTGGALQKFRNPKAQPKTYNWKGFRPEDEAILAETGEDAIDLNGFVIEDLEEMFPDVVKYIDDGDGNRTRPSYADTALIKYLVQALVELDTRVDELEDQLKTQ